MNVRLGLTLLISSSLFSAAGGESLTDRNSGQGAYDGHANHGVQVDLNRDGKADSAALSVMKDRVELVVRISGQTEPIRYEIPIDGSQQFGICSLGKPGLRVQPQSEAPLNALGEYPAGYEVCASCLELEVSDAECDPLQFYWDVKDNRLGWWRA